MPRRKKAETASNEATGKAVTSLKYRATRKNIPLAGLESHGMVREEEPLKYRHNPHLPPVLRSSPNAAATDRLQEVLVAARQRALSEEEAKLLEGAVKRHEPWLEWSGKRERPWFEVDPVALHMHERVSTQAILRALARQDVHRDLFADPQQDYAKAVQFYRHDVDWANRMILGDSLQVMASLARREDLAGKVQMIYVDPPYGIKFASNFQPQLGNRDVRDREQDLTREPEMVRAYRDTWILGVHSYLAYLRDRLAMARELLSDTGSIFVQIGDKNLHRVRCLMDEVFGIENFCVLISFRKTASRATTLIAEENDYILWYAKDKQHVKFRQPLTRKKLSNLRSYKYLVSEDATSARTVSAGKIGDVSIVPNGWGLAQLSFAVSQESGKQEERCFSFRDRSFDCGSNRHWKTSNPAGLNRLAGAARLLDLASQINYVRYYSDAEYTPFGNIWSDTGSAGFSNTDPKIYVVQTDTRVIERCLLMTTDPGDLVLDPTCGSGTTSFVAERWGRRWISIDTSRVALSLAKHRLMTAKFDYFKLRELNANDVVRNPMGAWIAETDVEGYPTGKPMTFQCKTVSHITLKSIARNVSLDPIIAKHGSTLAEKLSALNRGLSEVDDDLKATLVGKLVEKHCDKSAKAITDADLRRWLLPNADPGLIQTVPARKRRKGMTVRQVERYRAAIPQKEWKDWDAPFDADPDWPESLQKALSAYRAAWREKMVEVNGCIAANAETEELVDHPEVIGGIVRVAGPFTMEGVIALEDGPDSPIGGAPEMLESFDANESGDCAIANAEAYLDKVIRLLKTTGVDFPGNRNMRFSRLDPVTGTTLLHAEGEWVSATDEELKVAVSVGPEVGNVTSMQVEDVIHGANRAGYDDVVFAGFGFDAAAQEGIESGSHPRLHLHMAMIRPDVAMDDLLKTQPGSQLFTVFAAPRVRGPTRQQDGEYVVEVEGMDVYDPVGGSLFPTSRQHIAAWFVDTDYDGRTFCVCQAFFPDRSKWNHLARTLGDEGIVERGAFDRLSGFKSLPFPRPSRVADGESWRVAVKVIDPRGNEGLRVMTVRY